MAHSRIRMAEINANQENINHRLVNLKLVEDITTLKNAHLNNGLFRSKIPILKSRQPLAFKSTNLNHFHVKESSPKPVIENIDNESNCLLMSDYAPEIYKYLHLLEKKQKLQGNISITLRNRSILVNWVMEVHKSFRLFPETLYLAVFIIDRILTRERVDKNKLQLLGATALLVAAKFEEIYYPDIKEICIICDNAYSKHEILQMEIQILTILDFQLSGPSPLYFLRRGSKAAHSDPRVHMIGKYICELSLLEHQCSFWLPSCIAATALYFALLIDSENENIDDSSFWTPTIEHYTGYSAKEIQKLLPIISRLIISNETSHFQICRKKYSSSKFMNISEYLINTNPMKIIKKLANMDKI